MRSLLSLAETKIAFPTPSAVGTGPLVCHRIDDRHPTQGLGTPESATLQASRSSVSLHAPSIHSPNPQEIANDQLTTTTNQSDDNPPVSVEVPPGRL